MRPARGSVGRRWIARIKPTLVGIGAALTFFTSTGAAQPRSTDSRQEGEVAPNRARGAAVADSDVGESSQPEVRLPVIEFAPTVPYPKAQIGSGISGRVVLKLVVGLDGLAHQPEVLQALGDEFDQAALSSLSSFRFVPAERAGQPIAVRILLPIDFVAPKAADSPESPEAVPEVPPPIEAPVPGTKSAPPTRKRATSGTTLPEQGGLQEVQIYGQLSEATRLEKSADAVTVVRLAEAKQRSSDMADVLSRAPGIVVRRSGGLGSNVRFSINGLYGSAVRTFVDGIPLEMSGLPTNAGAISVNLLDHVEIYRGVVPLRLAADALGGAMNLVTDKRFDDHASLSYLAGSFGTLRGSALLQTHHSSDFVFRATGYADQARNDYLVDVEVPDDEGRLSPAQVPIKNNAYQAVGGSVELGVVEKSWADRLLFRGFYSSSSKEYGHNLVMSVPYGEVNEGQLGGGGQVLYEVQPSPSTRLEHTTNYSHRSYDYIDVAEWVYDWYGNQVRARRIAGEVESRPHDLSIWDDMVFSRTLFEWTPWRDQFLLFNVTPKFTTRTGDERRQADPDARDPLTARSDAFSAILGVGHEWNAFPVSAGGESAGLRRGVDYRLQNVFNVKGYFYALAAEEPLPGGVFRDSSRSDLNFGVADALRFALDERWSLKASYEYATRLPDSREVFGDGAFVQPNLALEPEVSHNLNFGPLLDAQGTATGDWVTFANVGLRDTDHMIVLLGNDRFYSYQNVYRAVTWFGEGGVSWISKGRFLSIDGSLTANDTRNQSDSGTFADFKGDRIPNRPPVAASWAASLSFSNVFLKGDRIEPFYQGSFRSGFYRGWESQGILQFKQRIDGQQWHDAGITYVLSTIHTRFSNTFEVQNLTNERLYENFGQQRPGRAFYWKLVADFF